MPAPARPHSRIWASTTRPFCSVPLTKKTTRRVLIPCISSRSYAARIARRTPRPFQFGCGRNVVGILFANPPILVPPKPRFSRDPVLLKRRRRDCARAQAHPRRLAWAPCRRNCRPNSHPRRLAPYTRVSEAGWHWACWPRISLLRGSPLPSPQRQVGLPQGSGKPIWCCCLLDPVEFQLRILDAPDKSATLVSFDVERLTSTGDRISLAVSSVGVRLSLRRCWPSTRPNDCISGRTADAAPRCSRNCAPPTMASALRRSGRLARCSAPRCHHDLLCRPRTPLIGQMWQNACTMAAYHSHLLFDHGGSAFRRHRRKLIFPRKPLRVCVAMAGFLMTAGNSPPGPQNLESLSGF